MIAPKNKRLQKPVKKSQEEKPSHEVSAIKNKSPHPFIIYIALHAHILFASLSKLLKTPLTSLMTMLVLAISLSLASSFYVLLHNVQQLTGNLDDSSQISLFLNTNITDLEGRQLAIKIEQFPNVKKVDLITQEAALTEFKAYSGFGDALDVLVSNPLPMVIQVLPKNTLNTPEKLQRLIDKLKELKEVDIAQMDMQWVRRLQSMMILAQYGVMILSCVLGLGILFIMGNTIRLELEDRRDEVLIAKLVGATHAFIQRPFLYTGFWFGLFSGSIAWVMVTVIVFILKSPMERLSELYDSDYEILFLNITEGFTLLFISSLLGILGSWIALFHQLREIKLDSMN